MDTLQQVKLEKIEGLLQVLVNLLDKKHYKSSREYDSKTSSQE